MNKVLTPAELDVLKRVARGCTNYEIARERGTHFQTVKNQITAIFDKLGVSNRTAAAVWLVGHGYV